MAIIPILAMLILGFLPIIPVQAISTEVYFKPKFYDYTTETMGVDDRFNVTIWAKGEMDMKAWQVKFYFDDDLINATRWWEPTWDTNYVFYGKATYPAPTPPDIWKGYTHIGPGNASIGFGSVLASAPSPGGGFSGDGLLAIIEFKILLGPLKMENLTCPLHFETASLYTYYIKAGETGKTAFQIHTDGEYSLAWVYPPLPKLAVRPNSLSFGPWEDVIGKKFNVTVQIEDYDAAWGITQAIFCLCYNTTLVNMTSYWVGAIWTTSSVVYTAGTPDRIDVSVSVPTSPPPTGTVELIKIEFVIRYQRVVPPAPVGSHDDTDLDICSHEIEDHTFAIPTNPPVDGKVIIYSFMSLPLPYLEVVPHETVLGPEPSIGKEFSVDIVVRNLRPEWYVVGIQMRLCFDDLLLEGVSITIGPFLKDPRWNLFGTVDAAHFDPPQYPFRACAVIGVLIKPNMTTHNYDQWTQFPQAEGPDVEPLDPPANPIFATVTLRAIKQLTVWPMVNLTDTLEIRDSSLEHRYFFDKDHNIVPEGTHLHGTYIMQSTWTSGRVIDVYGGVCDTDGHGNCPYPAPYGGQGLNKPMDMVWPQKMVCLFAKVTYNFWPVQDKVVTFQIVGPNFYYIDTNTTNTDGIAVLEFRMPWEGCEQPESYFGIYTVTTAVDLYCQTIYDTLQFHYDYAVRIDSVTTNKIYYNHLETVHVTVTIKSYAMQKLFPTTVWAFILDEVKQPLPGDWFSWDTIADANRSIKDWCKYKTYRATFDILIPKWAAAGTATVHVNAFCSIHVNAWCPEFKPYPIIYILPN